MATEKDFNCPKCGTLVERTWANRIDPSRRSGNCPTCKGIVTNGKAKEKAKDGIGAVEAGSKAGSPVGRKAGTVQEKLCANLEKARAARAAKRAESLSPAHKAIAARVTAARTGSASASTPAERTGIRGALADFFGW